MSASVAPLARASFGECSDPAYLAKFDERFRTMEYDCVESLRLPFATRGGTRHIRVIHDRNADWIADRATIAEFARGATLSIAAFDQLGSIHNDDITILLADDFPPREDADTFSNMAAITETNADGECRITVYLVGPASRPEFAAWVTSHELFHCVQGANLSMEQLASPGGLGEGGGGNWWLEGSANWFAALAIPEIGPLADFVDQFDATSATVPLNEMAYEAAPFFLWYYQQTRASAIVPFLQSMAPSSAASAQRAAMMAALPQDRWLDFAEDYMDREIHHPHGADLGLDPQDGPVWSWSDTRTESFGLQPFTLARGVAAFECGRWRASVRPNTAHSARPEDGGEWSVLPTEINTTSGSGGSYRVVAMSASASPVTLQISGTRESRCENCAGVNTRDACVVGTWQLTGGGPAEWMLRQGVPNNLSVSNGLVQYRADGTFVTSIANADIDQRPDEDVHVHGQVQQQATGRWSTSGGRLNLCEDTQARAGSVNITTRNGSGSIPAVSMPPARSSERYTCAAGRLDTERDMSSGRPGAPSMPPMPFNYTRVGE